MKLLADCIPALTLPAGGPGGKSLSLNEIFKGKNIIDMQSLKNYWPDTRENGNDPRWKHGDLEDVAYPFVKNLFDQLTGNRSVSP